MLGRSTTFHWVIWKTTSRRRAKFGCGVTVSVCRCGGTTDAAEGKVGLIFQGHVLVNSSQFLALALSVGQLEKWTKYQIDLCSLVSLVNLYSTTTYPPFTLSTGSPGHEYFLLIILTEMANDRFPIAKPVRQPKAAAGVPYRFMLLPGLALLARSCQASQALCPHWHHWHH